MSQRFHRVTAGPGQIGRLRIVAGIRADNGPTEQKSWTFFAP